ncbi:MAG: hypothetical protein AUJ12_01915 [Alphaproteobacteria bacterium CG1_02_46_17]|nr:MAG: hypothetical protein AUJ12_01915 [Alphaproteobacteria bacterium CG1_02_46_17]
MLRGLRKRVLPLSFLAAVTGLSVDAYAQYDFVTSAALGAMAVDSLSGDSDKKSAAVHKEERENKLVELATSEAYEGMRIPVSGHPFVASNPEKWLPECQKQFSIRVGVRDGVTPQLAKQVLECVSEKHEDNKGMFLLGMLGGTALIVGATCVAASNRRQPL